MRPVAAILTIQARPAAPEKDSTHSLMLRLIRLTCERRSIRSARRFPQPPTTIMTSKQRIIGKAKSRLSLPPTQKILSLRLRNSNLKPSHLSQTTYKSAKSTLFLTQVSVLFAVYRPSQKILQWMTVKQLSETRSATGRHQHQNLFLKA